jgi:hypothetical protein
MNEFIDLLNQNQGVLAVVAIGITIIGGTIAWFLKRDKNVSVHHNFPFIDAGHGVSAGGDIIVGGSKTQLASENVPTVVIKPDSFTHNSGRFDILFENTSQSTAIIQELKIGENNVNIDEFSLSPGQQARKRLNVGGFKILEEKIDTPNFKLLYKDFSNNKRYKTIGNIIQEPRADGKYNLGKISEISFLAVNQDSSTSNLEKRVLAKLYSEYKKAGQKTKWKATETFKELGIGDGQDVSTLHDSKFISIVLEGTHECFVITAEGIRYMDNQ